jgi:hypothetical protein
MFVWNVVDVQKIALSEQLRFAQVLVVQPQLFQANLADPVHVPVDDLFSLKPTAFLRCLRGLGSGI